MVSEEVRPGTPLFQNVTGSAVEVKGGDSGLDDRTGRLVDLGDHPPSFAHLGQLFGIAPHREPFIGAVGISAPGRSRSVSNSIDLDANSANMTVIVCGGS